MAEQALSVTMKKALCLLLLAAGILVYLAWGFLHGAWNPFSSDNIGIYSLMAVLIGLGGVGLLILRWEEEERQG